MRYEFGGLILGGAYTWRGLFSEFYGTLPRQFCSPVLDRDKMIKSSAYNREFSFTPFGKTKGSENVFSNAKGRSLI